MATAVAVGWKLNGFGLEIDRGAGQGFHSGEEFGEKSGLKMAAKTIQAEQRLTDRKQMGTNGVEGSDSTLSCPRRK